MIKNLPSGWKRKRRFDPKKPYISNKMLYLAVSRMTGLRFDQANIAVRAVFTYIAQTLRERKQVVVTGFGSFTLNHRKGRTITTTLSNVFDPATKTMKHDVERTFVQPDSVHVKFTQTKAMKGFLNNPAVEKSTIR